MRKILLTFSCLALLGSASMAQKSVGINTLAPNPNAVLELVAPDGNQGLLVPRLSTAQREAAAFTQALGAAEEGLMVFDTDQQQFFFWSRGQWARNAAQSSNWFAGPLPDDALGQDGDFFLSSDGQIFRKQAGTFVLLNDLAPVLYTAGQGISIDAGQQISNTGDADADPANELLIDFSLSGTELRLEDAAGPRTIDLAPFLDDTDAQQLSLAGSELAISGGNAIDLAPFLDDTDAQQLSLAGSELAISGGNAIDLAPLVEYTGGNGVVVDAATRTISSGIWTLGTGSLSLADPSLSVGLGTAPLPGYRLTVDGRLKSAGLNELSDERFKTQVADLQDALAMVLALRGVRFDWRVADFPDRQFKTTPDIGFLAQEVERVVPELVHTDADGFKSVEYSRLTALLVEAVEQQQRQLDDQAAQLERLRQRLEAQGQAAQAREQDFSARLEQFQRQLDRLSQTSGQ